MLGRLATWMRILGCDVEYERDIPDSALVIRALAEGRVILTRDKLLMKRRSVQARSLFIESDRIGEQLRQVVRRFAITRAGLLTRCVRCNAELEGVKREAVEGLVPGYVYETQERFSRCPECTRIYWAGTHKEHILEGLSGVFKEET